MKFTNSIENAFLINLSNTDIIGNLIPFATLMMFTPFIDTKDNTTRDWFR